MAKPTPLSAAKISLAAFNEVLGRYPACIQAISQDKGAKPGRKTLAELDEYRYGEAVTAFAVRPLHILLPATYSDIPGTLKGVTYRLASLALGGRRATAIFSGLQTPSLKLTSDAPTGPLVCKITERSTSFPSFRPTLMKLVSARLLRHCSWQCMTQTMLSFSPMKPTTGSAETGKRCPSGIMLRNITPCARDLEALSQRLGVKAIDIERVAFVLMRQESGNVAAARATLDPEPSVSSVAKVTPPKTKRKTVDDDANDPEPPVRRSKRTKHSFESEA
ncbi:hypothetical protein B0T13DRAFT_492372 [Neurospora crassa]|nr:hypothetical protein B0T13DRAFT_492372 [Neurospora crassa]